MWGGVKLDHFMTGGGCVGELETPARNYLRHIEFVTQKYPRKLKLPTRNYPKTIKDRIIMRHIYKF